MKSITHDGQRAAGATAGEETARDRSTGELLAQLSAQVSTLVRDELRLAQLEMSRKGKQAGLGIGMLGSSGIIALYAVGCLLATAIIAISLVLPAWLAALIIGGALLLLSGGVALIGRGSLRRAGPPVPRQTAASVRADVEKIRATHR
jgi:uncharacterized membrane protein YqjE